MPGLTIDRIKRGLQKPPHIIVQRICQEFRQQAERYKAPKRAKQFTRKKLLQATQCENIENLWDQLSSQNYCVDCTPRTIDELNETCPGNSEFIFMRAADALAHKVDLLGTGLIFLGEKIDWHKDYKTDTRWPPAYCHDIEYNNLERPSDVKIPWEISRMQWVIPLGQMYLLTQDEKYALAVKNILIDWIDNNPYAYSINWSCTMEVALRIIVWTWFFHVFKASESWDDDDFRFKFLSNIYLHGDFTERHLEKSDINGNHYTADAAGLVFAGLFFSESERAKQWQQLGWNILSEEIIKQVSTDGVDFEGSVPYHRLVTELFLFPAMYRISNNLNIDAVYKDRIIKMGKFIAAYSRHDGSVPLLGDADDARTLPFGEQDINDHRYLIGMISKIFNANELMPYFTGSCSELFWNFGTKEIPTKNHFFQTHPSTQFKEGGYYIMRNELDHVFIDCAPIGLGGRGGHGHNDCLSFEAMLNGELLISDSGAYVYTASAKERNYFRSTLAHNTPMIDGVEINRFISPNDLWTLHFDAKPKVIDWRTNSDKDYFCGTHSGYEKLNHPVNIERHITLNHQTHELIIQDEFIGEGEHGIIVPLHFAIGVQAELKNDHLLLHRNGKCFKLRWNDSRRWDVDIVKNRVSLSYGTINETKTCQFKYHGYTNKLKLKISLELFSS